MNPVVFLPQGMKENAGQWARELAESCTVGSGQFCTRPNLVFATAGEATDKFLQEIRAAFESKEPHALLSSSTRDRLNESIGALRKAGAGVVTGGESLTGPGYRYANTLLSVSGETYLERPEEFQREAFGNEVLVVTAKNEDDLLQALEHLEGKSDDQRLFVCKRRRRGVVQPSSAGAAAQVRTHAQRQNADRRGREPGDEPRRALSATGHPGFTAVGIPASIARFTALQCYDNVREERLPRVLRATDASYNRCANSIIWCTWSAGDHRRPFMAGAPRSSRLRRAV